MNRFTLSSRRFFQLIVLLSVIIYSGFATYFFRSHQITLLGDARSRLMIGREIFDSITPGLVQIGAVWPPIPQLFYLPTIWMNGFFYSGLSGLLVSGFFALLTTYFMARLVSRLTHQRLPMLLAVLVFLLNTSYMYMASAPMSEAPFIALVVMSVCFFTEWAADGGAGSLALAGVSALFASLCRYEGYMLVFVSIASIVALGLKRRTKWADIAGRAFLYAAPACMGIFLWLVYNQLIFGNLFHFVLGETLSYSRASGAVSLTKGHPVVSLLSLFYAGVDTAGVFSTLLMLIVFWLVAYREKYQYIVPSILFLSPLLFTLMTLFTGSSDIFTLHNAGFFYNVRLGLLLLPLVSLSYAFLAEWQYTKIIAVALLLLQSLFYIFSTPVTLREAINSSLGERGLSQSAVVSWLRNHPTDGRVLISYISNQTVVFDARIPLRTVISENNGVYWKNALAHPGFQVHRIIVSPTAGDGVWQESLRDPKFFVDFTKVYQSNDFIVYDLKPNLTLTRK